MFDIETRNTLSVGTYRLAENEYISDDCMSILCSRCGETRRVKVYSSFFKSYIWTSSNHDSPLLCSCERKAVEEKEEQEKKERFMNLYDCEELRDLVGRKYIGCRFEYIVKSLNKSYNAAYDACRFLCKDKNDTISNGKGIYVWSRSPGTGKSTLLACVRNEFIGEYMPCVFINSSDLIRYASYRNDDENAKFNFSMFHRVPLLIVDDIGAQSLDRNTPYCAWANDVWYTLMEIRNRNKLSTMFTSNYPPNELKDRGMDFKTVDRIFEMCAGSVYEINGMSFRGK